mmetsp:Transcript_18298/g.41948  ORF Transcript_18298/g.41948 Transcript_18298/m.41948 type:complete len:80 (-) Transcript_18298:558-797(-)
MQLLSPDPFSSRDFEEELYAFLEEKWIQPCIATMGFAARGFCYFGPPIVIVPPVLIGLVLLLSWCEKRQASRVAKPKSE